MCQTQPNRCVEVATRFWLRAFSLALTIAPTALPWGLLVPGGQLILWVNLSGGTAPRCAETAGAT
jgi:hypothetical protein